jgi:AraC-like DNA-binding protein
MDLDTQCIPLGHILTYFNINKKPDLGLDVVEGDGSSRASHLNELMKASMGLDHNELFMNVGIDLSDGGVAGRYMSTRQVLGLVEQTMTAIKMPYLGLFIGNIMSVSHHGMAGLAAVTQPTLKDCAETVARFCRELFPPLEMSVHIDGDLSWFTIEENISLAPYTHYFIELNSVSFYNIVSDLVGRDPELMPIRVEFAYPEPEWGRIYRRYFQCPVVFDCPQNRIIRKASVADYELPLANRLLAMTAEKTLFQRIPTRAMRFLPLKLRHFLLRSYGALPSLEVAASELGMSGRTMRRKLAESGTTYQQELDVIRERFARGYFARGGSSVAELAQLLEFSTPSAFSKAFKRWTGETPSEYVARSKGKTITEESV